MVTVLEAINEYKKFVDEISLMLTAFASVNGNERNGYLTELGWTTNEVKGYQVGVMRYTPVERIKSALISDMPDKDTLQNRLRHVWYELCGTCHFSDSNYFPVFDGSLFSHENKTLLESLTKIEGARYAYEILTRLEQIVHWANIRISNVYKYLVELSQFSGLPRCTKNDDKGGIKQSEKPNVAEDEEITIVYSEELKSLFHGRTDLIEQLAGLSDDEIANKIKKWAVQKDNFGKPLIENPKNQLRTAFADALKKDSLIKCSARTFRDKL